MAADADTGDAAAAAAADPMALVRGLYDADELAVAGEFLTTWLPFLSAGLCPPCVASLRGRVASLLPRADESPGRPPPPPQEESDRVERTGWGSDPAHPQHLPFEATGWDSDPAPPPPPPQQQQQQQQQQPRMSWADMAQEDELAAAAEEDAAAAAADDREEEAGRPRVHLTREQREQRRFRNVVPRKDFMCYERVKGRLVNILAGLELHAGVFSTAEQRRIVDCVYDLQEQGKRGELGASYLLWLNPSTNILFPMPDRTYTEPEKWMRGKGRVTIQFGCCYNYATDKNGNPPGIIRTFASDPIPDLFKVMIKRLIRWRILPADCVPDSCIVNIYDPGDCIPPHIDSHDFVRPFSTVSFLSECNILFGSTLKIAGPGEFTGSFAIPLPVGSVLVINGNGADVAKHCVPAVPSKRISITFRKMDPAKRPFGFKDDPELLNITPMEAASEEISSSRSSDEGKGKQLDVQNKNLGSKTSRSKRSKARASAGKAGLGGILGDQPPQHPQAPISSASSEREREFIGRSREPRYPHGAPGVLPHMGDARERLNMLPQERKPGSGVYFVNNGAQSQERRQRMEHRQLLMINRTINEDMNSLSVRSYESSDQPRVSVRTVSNKPRTRVYLDG